MDSYTLLMPKVRLGIVGIDLTSWKVIIGGGAPFQKPGQLPTSIPTDDEERKEISGQKGGRIYS
ncbi:hypothetical protein [Cupriavidus necator]|uniref:hypothetical protein n=1 Tax=Cupriavidus necator TaxID=106590 RepID=UPI000F4E96A2|nr:hypothetical protein [Cupriavidus necator]